MFITVFGRLCPHKPHIVTQKNKFHIPMSMQLSETYGLNLVPEDVRTKGAA